MPNHAAPASGREAAGTRLARTGPSLAGAPSASTVAEAASARAVDSDADAFAALTASLALAVASASSESAAAAAAADDCEYPRGRLLCGCGSDGGASTSMPAAAAYAIGGAPFFDAVVAKRPCLPPPTTVACGKPSTAARAVDSEDADTAVGRRGAPATAEIAASAASLSGALEAAFVPPRGKVRNRLDTALRAAVRAASTLDPAGTDILKIEKSTRIS